MANFKARVLDIALKQINELTDITASYEQNKQGRVITGFSFNFRQKLQTQVKEVRTDTFLKLSEAQLNTFSSKLAEIPDVANMAQIGEDMNPFVSRLRTMLMDEQDQQKLRPYLAQVGFVTR